MELRQAIQQFIDSLRRRGYAANYLLSHARQLACFADWATENGIESIDQLSESTGHRFHDHLVDKSVGPRLRREQLTKLRRLVEFLDRKGITPGLAASVPVLDRHGTIRIKTVLVPKAPKSPKAPSSVSPQTSDIAAQRKRSPTTQSLAGS